MRNIYLTISICLIASWSIAQKKAEVAFVIKENDLIPEGITYNPSQRNFFVGSIYKSKIISISEKGVVSDFIKSGQDGILQVLGMTVDSEGKLWACNNSPEHDTTNRVANVHVFDAETGKLLQHYKLADGKKHLFNDIHIMRNGDAYVTDSDGGGVYVIRKGATQAEEFIKPGTFPYPNGLTADAEEKKLFVSTSSGRGIVSIDIASKEIKTVPHSRFFILGTDGLYRYQNSLIGVQNILFPDGIVRFNFSDDGQSFKSLEMLAMDPDKIITPTTGVIAGNHFYFIANSQLFQLIGNQGKIKDPAGLQDIVIMKIALN